MSPSDKQIIFSLVGVGRVYPPKKQVLKDIYLSFYYGAKIGVLGLNGSGKSTLLRIIAGVDKDYLGEVTFAKGYTVGLLEQEPRLDQGKTVKEIVEEGRRDVINLLREYEAVSGRLGEELSPDEMEKLLEKQSRLQEQIEAVNGWELENQLEIAMDALRRPPPAGFWRSTGGTACPSKGTTPRGWSRNRRVWRRRRRRTPGGARHWSASWNGSACRRKAGTPRGRPA